MSLPVSDPPVPAGNTVFACVGRVFPLYPGDFVDTQEQGVYLRSTVREYVVGRGQSAEQPGVEVQIRGERHFTSCRHVTLQCDFTNGIITLVNQSPRNGTYINDSKTCLPTNASVRLEDGDVVHLGPPDHICTGSFMFSGVYSLA